jgi:endo-beta-N-acetylglucosaminidase D
MDEKIIKKEVLGIYEPDLNTNSSEFNYNFDEEEDRFWIDSD